MKPRILVAGLVRNPPRTLVGELKKLERILGEDFSVEFLLVESDSTNPNVEAILSLASKRVATLELLRLGRLDDKFPGRVERIAKCRDAYMEFLDSRPDIEFLCVFDADGVNKKISSEGVKSAMGLSDWVALFANQLGPYYDIYALRKEGWVSKDCFSEMSHLEALGFNEGLAFYMAVKSKMLRIPKSHPPIEVDSAFGGFAIYKAHAIRGLRYWHSDLSFQECEHVHFNRQIHHPGRKLIVPSLINASYTEHTYQLRPGVTGWLLRNQGIREKLKMFIPKNFHHRVEVAVSRLLS